MNTPSLSYAAGEWLAVVGPRTWALVDIRINHQRVQALWEASHAGLEELLEALLRDGLRSLPGFVIASIDDDRLRYAVRSPGALHVEGPGENQTIDAIGRDPWEGGQIRTMPRRILLQSDAEQPEAQLPTAVGVTSASTLLVALEHSSTTHQAPTEAQPPVEAEHPLIPVAEASAAPGRTSDATPAGAAGARLADDHAANYLQLLISSTTDRDELLSKLSGYSETHSEPADTTPAAKPTSDVTSVWTGDPDDQTSWTADPPTTAEPATDDPPAAPKAPLIDGVPWARGGPPSPAAGQHGASAQPATTLMMPTIAHPLRGSQPLKTSSVAPETPSAQTEADDALSVTISRAALRRQLESSKAEGPMVLALQCTAGHLSPSYAATCRVCGADLSDQSPIEVERPALGQLVLSNGSSVTLDKGVIFGRAPQSDIEDPARRPNEVRLIDPEISRMHASVMLDGWQVLLRDLGSQNGTILTLPGREPQQIRPQEDYILEPGSEVSFADVVSCKFEVTV